MSKVLYLAESSDSAQYRYRVLNVEASLKSSSQWQAAHFLKSDLSELKQALSSADLLIILRQTSKDSVLPNLIKVAKSQGVKVVFDLDDLIFDHRDLPLLMRSTNSKNIFYWTGYFWGIRRIARLADGFIATNDFLADKLKRSFKKPVVVIPNSLNSKQIKLSKQLCENKKPHNGFILGYFSGSPTHAKDFRLIEPAIIDFLKKHADAKLKIVGYMDFSTCARELLAAGRIEFEAPVDYLELQKRMSEVDVNLAPLVDNDFTNCKSELKFFEAAIVETPTIASPTFAFRRAIKDGKTGFLAKPGEWFDKLEYIYNHRKEAQKIALAAKKYCLENYYGQNFLKQVEEAYDAISK